METEMRESVRGNLGVRERNRELRTTTRLYMVSDDFSG